MADHKKDQVTALFDTSNVNNNLGPFVVACLIAFLVAVVAIVFGGAAHHWRI